MAHVLPRQAILDPAGCGGLPWGSQDILSEDGARIQMRKLEGRL